MAFNNLIVVGASAGGVQTTSQLLSLLGPTLLAAIVVVVHISPSSTGVLPAIFGRCTRLRVKRAEHGDLLTDGYVYVAPPDQHALVRDGRIEINRGPRENRQRPGIDPLFRSAALAHGPRVVGVVLTGLLDDGTAGLGVIKRCGGVAVVQEPAEALFAPMPQSALDHVQVDHRVGIAEMGPLLGRLAGTAVAASAEHSTTSNARPMDADVGGGPGAALRRSLRASLLLLEERAKTLDKMAEDEWRHGRGALAAAYAERSAESQQHAGEIRTLLDGRNVS